MTASAAAPARRPRARPATQIPAGPATHSARSQGSAMATSGTLTTVSTNGHPARSRALESRSSST